MNQRIYSLQALRFLAALGVVITHASLNFGGDSAKLGAMGVDVFFVISGFIITKVAKRSPSGFLVDRATRVLPPYYLIVLPWLIVVGANLEWRRLLATVLLWPVTDRFAMPYLFIAWSLCFEALFYFCVWLVLRGVPARLLVLAYAACFGLATVTHLALFDYLGSPLILEFLFGVAIALRPGAQRPQLGALALASGAALVIAFAAFQVVGPSGNILVGEGPPIRPLVWGVPAALLVYGAVQLPKLFSAKPIQFLGDASYAIYLTHLPVMLFLNGPPVWLAVLLSLVIGCLAHVFLERPAIRVARDVVRKFSGKKAPVVAAAVADISRR